MKCKNCYHYAICAGADVTMFDCGHFIDEEKIVELPFKVGDTVYALRLTCSCGGFEEKGKYFPTYSDCDDCEEKCDAEKIIVQKKFANIYNIFMYKNYINKSIFLSREEAEEALRKEKE